MELALRRAKTSVAFAGERARFLKGESNDVVHFVPDAKLSFVFIDADHTFEGVTADLAAWHPKVIPGGLISGHDWGESSQWGVKRAVELFFSGRRASKVTLGDGNTWFVRKREKQSN